MATKVRIARPSDIPLLVSLGRAMHAESPRFSGLAFDPERTAGVASRFLHDRSCLVLVAEDCGSLTGMFAGYVVQHFFSSASYASDLVLYVKPDHRGGTLAFRFIRWFESWAAKRGAAECVPAISTEVLVGKTMNFYERLGYQRSGVILRKRV